MRIAYVHQYFTTPEQGGGTRSYEFARRWVEAGHEVHMITASPSDAGIPGRWAPSSLEGIRIHAAQVPYSNRMGIGKRLGAFAAFASLASLRVRRLRPDVVFATSTPLTVAIPAKVGALRHGSPYVFEVRDQWPDVPIAMGYLGNPALRAAARRMELSAYAGAAHIVALAPGMKEDIVAKGVPREKVSVIPQGCDRHVFADPREVDPRAYPWAATPYLFTYAGAIGEANGLEYVVDLAEVLRSLRPSATVVVIGDGKQRSKLVAEAASRGVLGSQIHFLGPRSKGEVSRWFAGSAATLALFRGPRVLWKDAVQNKFFDSLAAGKPIANNHAGWQTQVAIEEGVGCAIDPSDAFLGARQLLAMVDDEEFMAAVPGNCRRLGEGRFNRDRQASEALAILERAAGVGPIGGAPVPLARG